MSPKNKNEVNQRTVVHIISGTRRLNTLIVVVALFARSLCVVFSPTISRHTRDRDLDRAFSRFGRIEVTKNTGLNAPCFALYCLAHHW